MPEESSSGGSGRSGDTTSPSDPFTEWADRFASKYNVGAEGTQGRTQRDTGSQYSTGSGGSSNKSSSSSRSSSGDRGSQGGRSTAGSSSSRDKQRDLEREIDEELKKLKKELGL